MKRATEALPLLDDEEERRAASNAAHAVDQFARMVGIIERTGNVPPPAIALPALQPAVAPEIVAPALDAAATTRTADPLFADMWAAMRRVATQGRQRLVLGQRMQSLVQAIAANWDAGNGVVMQLENIRAFARRSPWSPPAATLKRQYGLDFPDQPASDAKRMGGSSRFVLTFGRIPDGHAPERVVLRRAADLHIRASPPRKQDGSEDEGEGDDLALEEYDGDVDGEAFEYVMSSFKDLLFNVELGHSLLDTGATVHLCRVYEYFAHAVPGAADHFEQCSVVERADLTLDAFFRRHRGQINGRMLVALCIQLWHTLSQMLLKHQWHHNDPKLDNMMVVLLENEPRSPFYNAPWSYRCANGETLHVPVTWHQNHMLKIIDFGRSAGIIRDIELVDNVIMGAMDDDSVPLIEAIQKWPGGGVDAELAAMQSMFRTHLGDRPLNNPYDFLLDCVVALFPDPLLTPVPSTAVSAGRH
jgi:hypothetical protein